MSELTQAFDDGVTGCAARASVGVGERQTAETCQLRRRLCLGGDRRGEEAEGARNERSPVYHSITSSARASTDGGMVRPRALAVLRLITSSNLVGSWTGRSA